MVWESLAEKYSGRGAGTRIDDEMYLVTYERKDQKTVVIILGPGVCEKSAFQEGDKVDVLLDRETNRCQVEAVANGVRGWTLIGEKKCKRLRRKQMLHFAIPVRRGMFQTDVATAEDRHKPRSKWVPHRAINISPGSIEFYLDKKRVKFAK